MTKMRVEKFHHRLAKGSEVARRAAGNQVAVHDDRLIYPNAAGVLQIVLDAERAGDAFAFQDFRRGRNPAAMTDEGDEFVLLEKLARERKHLGVAPQFVRHKTARHEQSAEIPAVRILQKQIRLRRIT